MQHAFGKWSAWSYDTFAARGATRRFYRWQFEDEVREYTQSLDLHADDLVVDAGCGTGNYTLALAKTTARGCAIGIDISTAMLTLLQQHAEREGPTNVVLLLASVENLPFRTSSIPKIFNGCLHHLFPRIAPTLSEAQRCLTNHGVFVGSTFFETRRALLRIVQKPAALSLVARPVKADVLERGLYEAGLRQVTVDAGDLKRFFFGVYRAVKVDEAVGSA
jgi:ubiquinone/menaquinone biosynthesis C-methylase UbiE